MSETTNSASARMKAVSRLVAMLEAMDAADREWAMRSLNELFPATQPAPGSMTGSGPTFAAR